MLQERNCLTRTVTVVDTTAPVLVRELYCELVTTMLVQQPDPGENSVQVEL